MKYIIFIIILLGGCASNTEHYDNRYEHTPRSPRDIEPHRLLSGKKIIYPPGFLEKGIEGIVVLEHDVLKDGKAGNIEIIFAEPEGYLEEVALKTARTWRYRPATRLGEKMNTRGIRAYISFCIDLDNRRELSLRQDFCEPGSSKEEFIRSYSRSVSYDNL